jgi:hypothetical protein
MHMFNAAFAHYSAEPPLASAANVPPNSSLVNIIAVERDEQGAHHVAV